MRQAVDAKSFKGFNKNFAFSCWALAKAVCRQGCALLEQAAVLVMAGMWGGMAVSVDTGLEWCCDFVMLTVLGSGGDTGCRGLNKRILKR